MMMKPLPPLKSLVPFHTVARLLSISRAAEQLCVSHSAVSQSIKQLEDYLGKKLFTRNKNKLDLTPMGERYYQQIDESLTIIMQATKQALAKNSQKIINVNMLSSFAMKWLIPKIASFQEHYPDYELRLSSEWRQTDFEREDVDLALYYGQGNWPECDASLLFEEEIAILASPKILNKTDTLTIEQAKQQFKFLYVKAIRREDNFTTYFNDCASREPEESSRLYVQNTLQSLQAAIHGSGVIAANIHFLNSEIEDGLLTKVVEKTVVTGNAFFLVHPKSRVSSKKIQAFKQWLLAEK